MLLKEKRDKISELHILVWSVLRFQTWEIVGDLVWCLKKNIKVCLYKVIPLFETKW